LGAPGFARRPATRQNAAVMDFLAADDFFILLPLDRPLPVGAHFETRSEILPVFSPQRARRTPGKSKNFALFVGFAARLKCPVLNPRNEQLPFFPLLVVQTRP
jgi:hypothetical protein